MNRYFSRAKRPLACLLPPRGERVLYICMYLYLTCPMVLLVRGKHDVLVVWCIRLMNNTLAKLEREDGLSGGGP